MSNQSALRMHLASKLKEFRIAKGLTQKQASELLGTKQSTLASWEIAKSQPDADMLLQICTLYKIEITDLLGVSSSGSVRTPLNANEQLLLNLYRAVPPAIQEHTLSGLRLWVEQSSAPAVPNNIRSFGGCFPNFGYASAGTGTMAQEEPLDWSYEFDPPKGATCTITIKGDSMEPRFSDGETVWVDTTKPVEPGQIGVFVINGEAYCKKFVRDEKGPRLVSLNPAYDPIVLSEDDEVRLFGRVIGK